MPTLAEKKFKSYIHVLSFLWKSNHCTEEEVKQQINFKVPCYICANVSLSQTLKMHLPRLEDSIILSFICDKF